jgi:hypothetical protein
MATRVKLGYRAKWEGPIHGFTVNTIRKFYPSLCAEHEFDDLLQEAYIVFMRCIEGFKPNPADPAAPQFMGYYKCSLRNHLMNLARTCGKTLYMEDVPEQAVEQDEAFLKVVFNELPGYIREMLMQACFGSDGRAAVCMKQLQDIFISS